MLPQSVRSLTTISQSKSANFDISHEIDEFLLAEKALVATKRKANVDIDKLGPELRELETQCVPLCALYEFLAQTRFLSSFRPYNFNSSERMSYYPREEAGGEGASLRPSVAPSSYSGSTSCPRHAPSRSPTSSRASSRFDGSGSCGANTTAFNSLTGSLQPTATTIGRALAAPEPVPVSPHLQKFPPPLPTAMRLAARNMA